MALSNSNRRSVKFSETRRQLITMLALPSPFAEKARNKEAGTSRRLIIAAPDYRQMADLSTARRSIAVDAGAFTCLGKAGRRPRPGHRQAISASWPEIRGRCVISSPRRGSISFHRPPQNALDIFSPRGVEAVGIAARRSFDGMKPCTSRSAHD